MLILAGITQQMPMSRFSSLFHIGRSKQLETLAGKLGMDFSRKDDFGMVKKLGNFQLFKKGSSRKIINLMTADDSWLESSYAIFDYRFTIQHGKSASTHFQTVFFMDSKKLALPQFLLKPEHFFHRIGKYLNWVQDIEFEAHPDFSEKYLVQSDFPNMLKGMMKEEVVQFFTIEDKWSLEGLNYYLIFYQNQKRLPIETIRSFHKKGLYLAKLLQEEDEEI